MWGLGYFWGGVGCVDENTRVTELTCWNKDESCEWIPCKMFFLPKYREEREKYEAKRGTPWKVSWTIRS